MHRLARLCIYLSIVAILAIALLYPAPTMAKPLAFSHGDLKGQDFSGQDLRGSAFAGANLESANFANADLRGAIFSASILRNADMHGADFTSGMLDQADLANTNLSNAILSDTIMLRSNFDSTTNIAGADFTDAILTNAQSKWLCQNAQGTNSKTGVNTRESLSCD